MTSSESKLIEDFIDGIPVVGPLWADALYTWIGVAKALNLRELREDGLRLPGGPDGPNVVDLIAPAPGPTQRAA